MRLEWCSDTTAAGWLAGSGTPWPQLITFGPAVFDAYARLRLLGDLDAWADDLAGGLPIPPPAFVWPADHQRCLASDVDPHWAGIGAGRDAIEALDGLDVVPANPAEPQPAYY